MLHQQGILLPKFAILALQCVSHWNPEFSCDRINFRNDQSQYYKMICQLYPSLQAPPTWVCIYHLVLPFGLRALKDESSSRSQITSAMYEAKVNTTSFIHLIYESLNYEKAWQTSSSINDHCCLDSGAYTWCRFSLEMTMFHVHNCIENMYQDVEYWKQTNKLNDKFVSFHDL